jgi:CBS domain-containing protein
MGSKQPSVSEVMTAELTVVGADATLEEADLVLRSTFITGVPVVDDHGALVGVITHADIVAYRFADRKPDSSNTGWTPDRQGDAAARGQVSDHGRPG